MINVNKLIRNVVRLAKGVHKPKEAICMDYNNKIHTISRIKYDKNGIITIAELSDPWNYRDFITQKDIKLVAYKKPVP